MPVSSFVTEISAPGITAAVASVILPVIWVVLCASKVEMLANIRRRILVADFISVPSMETVYTDQY
jgi:hypothetical protein